MRALCIALVLFALAACQPYRDGYYQRPKSATRSSTRLTEREPTLPEGVDPGTWIDLRYPPTPKLPALVGHYLGTVRGRGGLSISGFRAVYDKGKCTQTLLPASVKRHDRVAYLRERRTGNGSVAQDIERQTETVDVPYLRTIDNIDNLAEEIAIWTSNNNANCDMATPVRLEARVHGREHIGLLKGPSTLDYGHCGPRPVPTAAAARVSNNTVALGDLAVLDEADKILPKWLGQRVRLAQGDRVIEGTLKSYRSRTISVELADGSRVDVHALDALAIELSDPATPAAPLPPTASELECPTFLGTPPKGVF